MTKLKNKRRKNQTYAVAPIVIGWLRQKAFASVPGGRGAGERALSAFCSELAVSEYLPLYPDLSRWLKVKTP